MLVNLTITYFGIFGFVLDADTKLDEEVKEEIEKLLVINATAIILPYLRSTVTAITADAGIYPPVILPIINVADAIADVVGKRFSQ